MENITAAEGQIRHLYSHLNSEIIPGSVITELERAKREPSLFDRIEIWSRTDDPIAVGVIGKEKPRYFSIARWGDAELTLEEVKERLRVEKWLLRVDFDRRDFDFSHCDAYCADLWWTTCSA